MSLIACHDCDLLHPIQPLRDGQRALCMRCGAVLYRQRRDSLERALTLTLTALILFLVANFYPFMDFKIQGRVQESTLISGVIGLYKDGYWGISGLVLLTSIVFPLSKILAMLYVLLPLKFNRPVAHGAAIFRMVETLTPWAMTEVYMLGVLVAYIKLTKLATIVPGVALFAFAALIIVMAAADVVLEPHLVWRKLESKR
jgi:paraquat-inducible protein A